MSSMWGFRMVRKLLDSLYILGFLCFLIRFDHQQYRFKAILTCLNVIFVYHNFSFKFKCYVITSSKFTQFVVTLELTGYSIYYVVLIFSSELNQTPITSTWS